MKVHLDPHCDFPYQENHLPRRLYIQIEMREDEYLDWKAAEAEYRRWQYIINERVNAARDNNK